LRGVVLPESFEDMLLKKKPAIDNIIEKYFPRKADKKSIEFLCGKANYDYHIEACQKALTDPIWDLLDRGGKRWRPVLFLTIVEALGGDSKKLEDFCIIPEIVHEGTLMVDDVEDSSELRRKKPCTHLIFGQDIAVNAGNAMYYIPLSILIKNKRKLGCEKFSKACEIYIQEMINLSVGQAMDIAWHRGIANADKISESQYMQMCAYKTGTLARMSAKMAAVLCGADESKTEQIGKFAESIGIAFQIQDDVMDIMCPEKLGKKFGNDIKEGKRTLMVINTIQKAGEKDGKRLLEILGKHTDDMNERKEAIDLMNKFDSIEYANQIAMSIVEKSWKELEEILTRSKARDQLKSFADFAITRKC
jgi:geranylgeranyl diphosphate synthase type I